MSLLVRVRKAISAFVKYSTAKVLRASAYKHLQGYLERYTILHVGRIHVRFHRIKRPDITPFQHSHPFSYLSIVLLGGYTEVIGQEKKVHGLASIIVRRSQTAHRIISVKPGTLTLFFTLKTRNRTWRLDDDISRTPAPEWIDHQPGVYCRTLYGKVSFSKFDRYWHVAANDPETALQEYRPSIDQSTSGKMVCSLM